MIFGVLPTVVEMLRFAVIERWRLRRTVAAWPRWRR